MFCRIAALLAVALTPLVAHAQPAYAWGYNGSGQLGDGTTTQRTSPVQVNNLFSGVTAVSAGSSHSLAVQNGVALAWGDNANGQLGDGTTTSRTTTAAVTGLTSVVTAVSAGDNHSLAVRNGAALAWGLNGFGQLGDGTTTQRLTPVAVSGLSAGVSAVSAGTFHSLAIQQGMVWAWGSNSFGQVGDNSNTQRNAPVAVSGLSAEVTAVSAGGNHSLAVQNGQAFAWGQNTYGQLGAAAGDTTNRRTPTPVSTLTSGVTAVSGGNFHSLAIQNGEVWAWGNNAYGQIGDGSGHDQTTPVLVTGGTLPNDFVSVTAGGNSSYALTASHRLFAWGDNANGQLGLGSTQATFPTPQEVFAPSGYEWASIDGGGFHAVAILTPVPEPGCVLGLAAVAAGCVAVRRRRAVAATLSLVAVSAVLLTSPAAPAQTAYAWGRNGRGQVGDGTNNNIRTSPVPVSGLSSGVTAVSGGSAHSLAIQQGAVWAWGNNTSGQLGDNSTTQRDTPVPVFGLSSGVTAVSAGNIHSLAIRSDGAVLAWGDNSNGQLGVPGYAGSSTPLLVPVGTLASQVSAVSGGSAHSLAIQQGAAWAWGYNASGQVGDGTFGNTRSTPVPVSGLSSGVTAVSGGGNHSLAVVSGRAYAWGENARGQLGVAVGSTADQHTPTPVFGLISGVTAVAAGDNHSLAIQNGEVWAWGLNTNGQLGDGGISTQREVPVRVTGSALPHDFVSVTAGGNSSYALTASHRLFAWGDNTYGQLGLGDQLDRQVPTEVFAPSGFEWGDLDGGFNHAVAVLTPVPEPGCVLGLAATAVAGCVAVRRRRNRSGGGA